jgi:hypothetical protein
MRPQIFLPLPHPVHIHLNFLYDVHLAIHKHEDLAASYLTVTRKQKSEHGSYVGYIV